MDYQILFNIAFTAAGFLGGWVLNNMTNAINRLDADVRDMPKIYVTKDDWREDMRTFKSDMDKGFDKLDKTLGTIFKKLDAKPQSRGQRPAPGPLLAWARRNAIPKFPLARQPT